MTSNTGTPLDHHALRESAEDALVLYRSERTLVTRQRIAPTGEQRIFKQAFGEQASKRLRSETAILQLLSGVEGVPKIAPQPSPANTLVLHDDNGVPLSTFLATHALGIPAIVQLGLALAHVLAAVHRHGIIHKDITPANILISQEQHKPTLIDFNNASNVADALPGVGPQNVIAGTLRYMAPEQTGRTGHPVDLRADLYSLGVLLYEMTTGAPPFEGTDLLDLIHDHLVRTPTAPTEVNADTPPMLSQLIMRLLEKEPNRRYQSAQGLASDLERIQDALRRAEKTPFTLGQHDFAPHLLPPTQPIGRAHELARLQTAFEQALTGQTRFVLISGAPGIGKTTLAHGFRSLVMARGGWYVSGKFDQYRKDAPTATVQALRALGRLLLAEPEEQLARVRERMRKVMGPNASYGPAALPEFLLLLGPQPAAELTDPREGEARMVQATLDALTGIASPERPLVMVLEDLQWAPSVTRRFMDGLIRRAETIPGFLLVSTCRTLEADSPLPVKKHISDWLHLEENVCTEIALHNLPVADMGTMISNMLRLPVAQADALASALHERTEGNPYNTVEFINALRQDGVLIARNGAWDWDASAIHQYVGSANIANLMGRRIAKLADPAQEVLKLMACLGGDVSPQLMEFTSNMPADVLKQGLALALEDGLLITHQGSNDTVLRFRHDKAQQAVFESMPPIDRNQRHLRLARRLSEHPDFEAACAQQYLFAMDVGLEEAERRKVITLLHNTAMRLGVSNYGVAERFLAAAIVSLKTIATPQDTAWLVALEAAQHAALYGLGRMDEGDVVFDSIMARCPAPVDRAEPTAIQVNSYVTRGKYVDAITLGLAVLAELGLDKPQDVTAAIETGLQRLLQWHYAQDKQRDFQRPESTDPRLLACAKVLVHTANAAYFLNTGIGTWLAMEAHRLWIEYGPSRELMNSASFGIYQLTRHSLDNRAAYEIARHMIAVGEARGYLHGTAVARSVWCITAGHWVEPLEHIIPEFRKARLGALQAGDAIYATYTYLVVDLLIDGAPTLDEAATELELGFEFAKRTHNTDFRQRYLPRRQLIRVLRGETQQTGNFSDAEFDDAAYAHSLRSPNNATAVYHTTHAIAAAIFGDFTTLALHAPKALALQSYLAGYYSTALMRVLQALSLTDTARQLPWAERSHALKELDHTLVPWLAQRAADAPANFGHLLHWVEAERAWALDEIWNAGAAFDRARAASAQGARPWHHALITERAGLFHQAQGMLPSARALLQQACQLYQTWGASAKVRDMQQHKGLLDTELAQALPDRKKPGSAGTNISPDEVDMLAVLRASQALSSQTNLVQLTERLNHVLRTMTGATMVHMLAKSSDGDNWFVADTLGDESTAISVTQAHERGALAQSVFLYVQRTGEALLLDDAKQDDRFSNDPYFAPLVQCALLCVPIHSHGKLRAMLVLENHQSSAAFSTERMDAVLMIAGQMVVSLDNALLYASLENRVQQRTLKLEQANSQLAQAIQTLEKTKDELVRSEKLAALGSLVAGMAHELNTPIGNGLMAASTLDDRVNHFSVAMTHGLKRSTLDQFVTDTRFACDILTRNLSRSSELLHSFKQVAMDQTNSRRGHFRLQEVITELERALGPGLQRAQCTLVTGIAPDFELDSYPDLLEQVLSNLVSNAMIHAYGEGSSGNIQLVAKVLASDALEIQVIDSGRGVDADSLKHIFEPFYTTRLGQGGSGLGMYIVHNLVTGALGGSIGVHSSPGKGSVVTVTLPRKAPQTGTP